MQFRHLAPNRLFQFLDILAIVLCAVIMYRIRNNFWLPKGDYQLLLLVIIFVTLYVFSWWGVYKTEHGRWLYKSLSNLTTAWVIVALCLGMITFFTKSGETFSRLWVLMTFTSTYIVMISARLFAWSYSQAQQKGAQNRRNVVIIGAGQLGRNACDAIIEERWAGLKVVALFDDDINLENTRYRDVEIVGPISQAIDFIEDRRQAPEAAIKEVWIALPLTSAEKIEHLQTSLQNTATNVFLVPDLFGASFTQYSLVESAGIMMINLSATPMIGGSDRLKRIEDLFLSSIMGLVLSPVFVITALAIKLESSGPVFFKQRRYGLDGKEIIVWKFRSMTVAEDGDDVPQASRCDSRITKVGAVIRKYSIDELPQLINVFNGSMSLVGPRPHAVAHNEYYRDKVHGYMARHKIRPGITGWAQINGCRGETEVIEKMQRRLRYDLEYIQNWSIALDIRILFKTLHTIFTDKNAY
ncbi:undecaprenyl-phosphate glucose phosphotransferase [Arenicella xantha]|uniref:Putative colanic acid biosynthesis UDP-glucose lipid carrier transferase n=1 Tax=Arenicella xantha TaxID=644221 RepID=A0A395JMR3_9GAMM|nr:undecaprenyl-phosphate glucose phosphotransferase [Arenicella xantha]RBP52954.1 putative colanic acid biosynthesis UDP-glucose lipid carrier transferase [Arenicella xantha]